MHEPMTAFQASMIQLQLVCLGAELSAIAALLAVIVFMLRRRK